MKRFERYKKNIACLESLWDPDVERQLSVVPMLELIAKLNYVKFSRLSCNTIEEFKFCLRKLPASRKYRILYLAFHGTPGQIELADRSILPMEDVALLMGRKFEGSIIHFGTCGTLAIPKIRLKRFLDATRVSLLIGYKNNVDWAESAALDLILLDWIQNYKDMRPMWKYVSKTYRDLIGLTGLRVYPTQ